MSTRQILPNRFHDNPKLDLTYTNNSITLYDAKTVI